MQNDHVSERQATAMHKPFEDASGALKSFARGQVILQHEIECLYADIGCGGTCQSPREECFPTAQEQLDASQTST